MITLTFIINHLLKLFETMRKQGHVIIIGPDFSARMETFGQASCLAH